MPLIKNKQRKDVQFRIRMSEQVVKEINEYVEWAGLSSKDVFLEEAALFILGKDKEWKKAKAEKSNAKD